VALFNYYDKYEDVMHFGKIIKTDNTIQGTIIRSKWGDCGIFEGSINDLPDFYGNKAKFFRKNKK